MTADQRREWLIRSMAKPITTASQIAIQRFADAHAHAMARDGAKAKDRISTITSILTPHTGALWAGWADLYKALWRSRRLEIGDTHGVDWRTIGNDDAAKAIANVRIAQTTPLVFMEMHTGSITRLMAAAMRSSDPDRSMRAWNERSAAQMSAAIQHVAMTVAHRLSAITARQVIRPEFLEPDPTLSS